VKLNNTLFKTTCDNRRNLLLRLRVMLM